MWCSRAHQRFMEVKRRISVKDKSDLPDPAKPKPVEPIVKNPTLPPAPPATPNPAVTPNPVTPKPAVTPNPAVATAVQTAVQTAAQTAVQTATVAALTNVFTRLKTVVDRAVGKIEAMDPPPAIPPPAISPPAIPELPQDLEARLRRLEMGNMLMKAQVDYCNDRTVETKAAVIITAVFGAAAFVATVILNTKP